MTIWGPLLEYGPLVDGEALLPEDGPLLFGDVLSGPSQEGEPLLAEDGPLLLEAGLLLFGGVSTRAPFSSTLLPWPKGQRSQHHSFGKTVFRKSLPGASLSQRFNQTRRPPEPGSTTT